MAHSIHLAGCSATSTASCACEVRRYYYIFLLTLGIGVVEMIGSFVSGSIALLADTAHVSLDCVAAGISVYVAHTARTHADPVSLRLIWMRRSGWLLLLALAWIAYEAIGRFSGLHVVTAWRVMVTAGIAACLNYAQHRLVPHDHSMTAKAQHLHVAGDLASNIVVFVGGGLIWWTGRVWIDPVLSLVIVGGVSYLTIKMMRAPHSEDGHDHFGHSH